MWFNDCVIKFQFQIDNANVIEKNYLFLQKKHQLQSGFTIPKNM